MRKRLRRKLGKGEYAHAFLVQQLPIAYNKCDFTKSTQQVRLDIENGDAYFFADGEYHWFPTHKPCCSFYWDEECTQQIVMS